MSPLELILVWASSEAGLPGVDGQLSSELL